LSQNYPNPFNPETRIRFSIPNDDYVKIQVFNTLGQRVRTLIDKILQSGYHEVEFSGADLASGIYYYKISAGNFQNVKKMILLK
jgi:flagellar hook assembly protein FlgD